MALKDWKVRFANTLTSMQWRKGDILMEVYLLPKGISYDDSRLWRVRAIKDNSIYGIINEDFPKREQALKKAKFYMAKHQLNPPAIKPDSDKVGAKWRAIEYLYVKG